MGEILFLQRRPAGLFLVVDSFGKDAHGETVTVAVCFSVGSHGQWVSVKILLMYVAESLSLREHTSGG